MCFVKYRVSEYKSSIVESYGDVQTLRNVSGDKRNVVCVVYDTTSGKSTPLVNHGKIRDFACRLPLKASTLNLFNRVVHFDGASGFDGYIESVEVYNYYKSFPTGLIAARMKSLKFRKELMVALYEQIQKRCRVLSH